MKSFVLGVVRILFLSIIVGGTLVTAHSYYAADKGLPACGFTNCTCGTECDSCCMHTPCDCKTCECCACCCLRS